LHVFFESYLSGLSLAPLWFRNGGVAGKEEMYVRFNNEENAGEENNGYVVFITIIPLISWEKGWR
jgi:hypothetical protein